MARIDPEATIKRANELASKAASAGMEANTNSEAFHVEIPGFRGQ